MHSSDPPLIKKEVKVRFKICLSKNSTTYQLHWLFVSTALGFLQCGTSSFCFFLLYFHFTLLIIMITNDWFIIIGKNINHQKRHDSFSFLIQPGLRPSLCWIHHHCAAKKPNHFINKNHMLEMHYLCDQNQSWPSKKEPWLLLLNPCSIISLPTHWSWNTDIHYNLH